MSTAERRVRGLDVSSCGVRHHTRHPGTLAVVVTSLSVSVLTPDYEALNRCRLTRNGTARHTKHRHSRRRIRDEGLHGLTFVRREGRRPAPSMASLVVATSTTT